MGLRKLFRNITEPLAARWDTSVQPVLGYPSAIVDSQGCEFGFEMYYHIAYAYHLHSRGLLKKTISCRDTNCFYWFSPEHVERYDRRGWVPKYRSIAQQPHQAPDFSRWKVPDFRGRYHDRVEFGCSHPLLLIFNKYNGEWQGPPVNFLSKQQLLQIAAWAADRYQVVYFRPVSKIVADDSVVFELDEKQELAQHGVVMAEALHEKYPHLSFNEFQLCLLAQSDCRIAVQGGATYLNALFPGDLYVLHRQGAETDADTYEHLKRMPVSNLDVFQDEDVLFQTLVDRHQRVAVA